MAIDKLLNVSFQELFDPATVTDRVRVAFSGSWDIANLSTTLESSTLQYVKPSESTIQLNTESASADMNSATLAANAGLISRRGSVIGTLNTNVNFNTFSFPSSSAFGVYDGVGGLEIAFFSGSVQYNDAVTGSAEITSPGVNNFNLLGITPGQPDTIFEWTASNGTDVNQIQISYLFPVTASILPTTSSIPFNQLNGAGILNPDNFDANITYNITMGAPTCSGSAYFTMEATRDADGFFDGFSPQPAKANFTNFVNISQDTLIESKSPGAFGNHVWSIVIPPGGGTFDYIPNNITMFADTVRLRGTGGVTFTYSEADYVFSSKAQLVTAVNLWVSDNAAALSFYGEINTWNVSAITDMDELFKDKTTFNSNISAWDVSNVTTMRFMFDNAQNFNQNIDTWKVGKVENMFQMFINADSFNSPINSWDVSNVVNMRDMFYNAGSFQQPLNLWEVDSLSDARLFMGTTGGGGAITYTLLDTLLNGWVVNLAALQSNVIISFGDSTFTSAGLTARNILVNTKGWTITDGGQV